MTRIRGLMLMGVAAGMALAAAGGATAGPPGNGSDSDQSSYSPLRYWAPWLARGKDHCNGPKLSMYPPDRHPESPPLVLRLTYQKRTAPPEATIIDRPSAGADSPAR
ncbi:hypothetical protein [Fimbriiglobus ruber]|uniref:Uncharacterized protein n=1 Tax=Fimbriiglobus ruber TaxID=1908690 RepID=A0A225D0F3_9BACT|nr:hypothetical protein [Fimbriiglobus ruber]OWK35090.1 hypothetical protein FRUB_09932 [Fimbriiglobus ruber]